MGSGPQKQQRKFMVHLLSQQFGVGFCWGWDFVRILNYENSLGGGNSNIFFMFIPVWGNDLI